MSHEAVVVWILSGTSSSSPSSWPAPAQQATERCRDRVAIQQLLEGVSEVPVEVGIDNRVQSRIQISNPEEEIDQPGQILGNHLAFKYGEVDCVPNIKKKGIFFSKSH